MSTGGGLEVLDALIPIRISEFAEAEAEMRQRVSQLERLGAESSVKLPIEIEQKQAIEEIVDTTETVQGIDLIEAAFQRLCEKIQNRPEVLTQQDTQVALDRVKQIEDAFQNVRQNELTFQNPFNLGGGEIPLDFDQSFEIDLEVDDGPLKEAIDLTEVVSDNADEIGKLFGKSGKEVANMATKAGRLLGVIGLAGQAAVFVYDNVLNWVEASEGFNQSLVRSVELTNQVAGNQARVAQEQVRANANITDFDQRREQLNQYLTDALSAETAAAKAVEDASNLGGTFGQFGDGVNNSEIESIQEKARIELEAASKVADVYSAALGSLNSQADGTLASFNNDLERQRILLEEGEAALASFDLQASGILKEQADSLVAERLRLKANLDSQVESRNREKQTIQDQIKLELELIKIRDGEAAFRAARDSLDGVDRSAADAVRDEIAELKKKQDEEEEAAERQIKLRNEILKLQIAEAEERGDVEKAEELNDKLDRRLDLASGLSDEEAKQLAILRDKVEAAERESKRQEDLLDTKKEIADAEKDLIKANEKAIDLEQKLAEQQKRLADEGNVSTGAFNSASGFDRQGGIISKEADFQIEKRIAIQEDIKETNKKIADALAAVATNLSSLESLEDILEELQNQGIS